MNVIIPEKRRDGGSSFVKLVGYISARDEKPRDADLVSGTPNATPSNSNQAVFDRLVDYIDRGGSEFANIRVVGEFPDGRQQVIVGDVSCETNCFSWETAAAEMNMVAAQNRRCLDPVYHFILSWRENEIPTDAQIFECARHCIDAVGMEGHQFVTAIHQDTDNTHCHVAVNRINPQTYKAANLWNDADTLQKSCRVLEKKFGFEQDNGSWTWGANGQLVRSESQFKYAPQGAVQRQVYSDKESLFHYAVRQTREHISQALSEQESSWDQIHLMLHEKGLGLREQGQGLVVYDFLRPDDPPVKASSVHPLLTKGKLEPQLGDFTGPPSFESEDLDHGSYGILETYQPTFQVRDRDLRAERRQERADARAGLKQRYQAYRDGWVKPDLHAVERRQQIAAQYRAVKGNVRRQYRDPLMRKLMYRVAEFEQMKAMAELRIAIRKERVMLHDQGLARPLAYRPWVEQQALNGDSAAVSQLRGWSYREKRKESVLLRHNDRIILCGNVDDSPVFDRSTHTSQLRRNGAIEYVRDGIVSVVDHGDQVEIRPGFADYDDSANYRLAVGIVSTKSADSVQVVGDDLFVDRVLETGCRFNAHFSESRFPVTDPQQQERYAYLQSEPSVQDHYQVHVRHDWRGDEEVPNTHVNWRPDV